MRYSGKAKRRILSGSSISSRAVDNQRGSVLLSVLAVLLVLMIVFLSVLTYALARYSAHVRRANRIVAAGLAEAGVNHRIADMNREGIGESVQTERTPNGGRFQSAVIAWGPCPLVLSDGFYANQKVRCTALLGSRSPQLFLAAISVYRLDLPFVVSGNTRIVGSVLTGPEGMTEGQIEGRTVTSEDYHQGAVQKVNNLVAPSIDTTILRLYLSQADQRRSKPDQIFAGSHLLGPGNLNSVVRGHSVLIEDDLELRDATISADQSISSLFVGGRLTIAGGSRLTGLLEIVADGTITVSDSAALDEVILYSNDSIVFQGDCVFSGTAVSRAHILMADRSRLLYPSMLYLDAEHEAVDSSTGIRLVSAGLLEGTVVTYCDKRTTDTELPLLRAAPCTTLRGYILSQGELDAQGKIFGSIVTRQFGFRVSPTTYVNWVRDIHVNRTMLDFEPALPVLDNSGQPPNLRILRMDSDL